MTFTAFMNQREIKYVWVTHPGWRHMYVRHSQRYIEGEIRPCLDLANIEARRPGRGTFEKLLKEIESSWPGTLVYVESVMSYQFSQGLRRRGFRLDDPMYLTNSFYRRLGAEGAQM